MSVFYLIQVVNDEFPEEDEHHKKPLQKCPLVGFVCKWCQWSLSEIEIFVKIDGNLEKLHKFSENLEIDEKFIKIWGKSLSLKT